MEVRFSEAYGSFADSPLDEDTRNLGLFEWGVLPALFTICCKCRDFSIRKRAVALMRKYNWREGNNSSRTLAFFADAIIGLEESKKIELFNDLPECTVPIAVEIPERARFLDVVISADTDAPRTLILSCTRLSNDEMSQIELLEFRRRVPVEIRSIGTDLDFMPSSPSAGVQEDGALDGGMRCYQRIEIEYSNSVSSSI